MIALKMLVMAHGNVENVPIHIKALWSKPTIA
jgi:hypothetical protein